LPRLRAATSFLSHFIVTRHHLRHPTEKNLRKDGRGAAARALLRHPPTECWRTALKGIDGEFEVYRVVI
jgi:hypothetical protein